jgi:hypothetical protein
MATEQKLIQIMKPVKGTPLIHTHTHTHTDMTKKKKKNRQANNKKMAGAPARSPHPLLPYPPTEMK